MYIFFILNLKYPLQLLLVMLLVCLNQYHLQKLDSVIIYFVKLFMLAQ